MAAEPLESKLKHILNDASGLKEKRRRLCDISWFMRCLAEPIARRGNLEDKVSGRFWQARYRAVGLQDETSILACAAYVDLNPIRAAIAVTIEDSLVPPCDALWKTFQRCGWPAESDRWPSLEIEHAPLSSPPGRSGTVEFRLGLSGISGFCRR